MKIWLFSVKFPWKKKKKLVCTLWQFMHWIQKWNFAKTFFAFFFAKKKVSEHPPGMRNDVVFIVFVICSPRRWCANAFGLWMPEEHGLRFDRETWRKCEFKYLQCHVNIWILTNQIATFVSNTHWSQLLLLKNLLYRFN